MFFCGRRWRIVLFVFVALCHTALSQDKPDPPMNVRLTHGWTNVFAGKPARLECQVSSQAVAEATLYWSVSVDRGVIARGSRSFNLVPDRSTDVVIDVEFPELRPGLVAPAALTLQLQAAGRRVDRVVSMHVFSPDIGTNREQWLKSLEIVLFDPPKSTQARMNAARIPFRISEGPEGLPASRGLLIHGEGIDPARQIASWHAAQAAAASGRRVIVLASAGATLPVESLFAAGADGSNSITLRRSDVIHILDKRLDATQWPAPGRLVAASLHWTSKAGRPHVELRNDALGWPWVDIRYANGGRLIWTGIGLIESWETTPAARYLFVKMLEDLMVEEPVTRGQEHDAP